MARWLIAVLCLAASAGVTISTASAAGEKVGYMGYVDVARVMNTSKANKKALQLFKTGLESKQKDIDVLEADIKRLKDRLDKQKKSLSVSKRQQLQDLLRDKLREYRRMGEDHQADLDRQNRLWTKKITKALREVVEEVGRDGRFSVVFAKSPVFLYVDKSIDISDEVLRRLNARTARWF